MSQNSYLDQILGIVCSVFDAYSAVLFIQDGESYPLAAQFSLGDQVRRDVDMAPGMGLVGWILRNGKPLLINNFDRGRSKLGYYQGDVESQIKAFMGCPLRHGAGALCLDSKRTYSFSDKDQKILHLFCDLVLSLHTRFKAADEAVGYFDLYKSLLHIYSLRRRFTRWNLFLENILKLLSEATGFSFCFLAVLDEAGGGYYLEGCNRQLVPTGEGNGSIPLGSGYVGWVFKNNAPVSFGEQEAKGGGGLLFGRQGGSHSFKSAICLPLAVQGGAMGVLGLAHEASRPVDEDVKAFVDAVADHLALFLENLYLKNRLAEAVAEARDLRNQQLPDADASGS